MSKRMTDERLAEIEAVAEINDGYPDAFSGELLQALKAEREHIVELKATEGYQQMLIEELERQLAAVRALLGRIQTCVDGRSSVSRRMNLIRDILKEAALAGGEDGSK